MDGLISRPRSQRKKTGCPEESQDAWKLKRKRERAEEEGEGERGIGRKRIYYEESLKNLRRWEISDEEQKRHGIRISGLNKSYINRFPRQGEKRWDRMGRRL